MKKTVIFLEGGPDGTDCPEVESELKSRGFEIIILDNLYNEPKKLLKIPEINPDYLFIATTGLYSEERKMLKSEFGKLNYVPKAVLFWTEDCVMNYLTMARELKKLGTQFYFAPTSKWADEELNEIIWI